MQYIGMMITIAQATIIAAGSKTKKKKHFSMDFEQLISMLLVKNIVWQFFFIDNICDFNF